MSTLPFCRALNPSSNHSGITYAFAGVLSSCQGREMLDVTFLENLKKKYKGDSYLLGSIGSTFEVLYGSHFDMTMKGESETFGGAKGALDFTLLPLISRKLIADGAQTNNCGNYIIAAPLEIIRFLAALAITIVLIPVVIAVHATRSLINSCSSSTEESINNPDLRESLTPS